MFFPPTPQGRRFFRGQPVVATVITHGRSPLSCRSCGIDPTVNRSTPCLTRGHYTSPLILLLCNDCGLNAISQTLTESFWTLPNDVVVLACVEMHFLKMIFTAGVDDGSSQAQCKARLKVHTPTLQREISNDKFRLSNFGNDSVCDLVVVLFSVDSDGCRKSTILNYSRYDSYLIC